MKLQTIYKTHIDPIDSVPFYDHVAPAIVELAMTEYGETFNDYDEAMAHAYNTDGAEYTMALVEEAIRISK